MSRNGKGIPTGLECTDCGIRHYIQEITPVMKQEGKTITGSKKYCKQCRKHTALKTFSKFHMTDKKAKTKSKKNIAKAAAAKAALEAAAA